MGLATGTDNRRGTTVIGRPIRVDGGPVVAACCRISRTAGFDPLQSVATVRYQADPAKPGGRYCRRESDHTAGT
jgi:hypothetical protein